MKPALIALIAAPWTITPAMAAESVGARVSNGLATGILALWAVFALCAFVPVCRAALLALQRWRSPQIAVESSGAEVLSLDAEVSPSASD